MRQNFEQIMSWLEVYEGGYVNHPKDPGGATNHGVTQRVYDAARRSRGLPTRSVKYIERSEYFYIYARQYWTPVHGDRLPSGLDATVFDFAVNSGVRRASRTLQAALVHMGYRVAIDGHIGEETLAAVRAAQADNRIRALIVEVNQRRLAFVRSLSTFRHFGRGWTRRIMGQKMGVQSDDMGVIDRSVRLHERAAGMTNASIPVPAPTSVAPQKARDGDKRARSVIGEAIAAIFQALVGAITGRQKGVA